MSGLPNGRQRAAVLACLSMSLSADLVAQEAVQAPGAHEIVAQAVDQATEAAAVEKAPDEEEKEELPGEEPDAAPADAEEQPISDQEAAALQQALAADGSADDDSSDDSAGASTSLPAGSVDSTGSSGSTGAVGSAGAVDFDLSLILDVAGAWFSQEDPPQVGAHDPSVTGFNFQQLEMAVGASVDPYFRFDANMVFSLFGVEVEEAYATTLALPASLQARAGQFLTPFGRLNQVHPHAWAFLDLPLVNGKFFGGEGSRGVGAELSWLSPLPWYVELVGAATQANAKGFYSGDEIAVSSPADLLYTTRIEQFFPLGEALSLLWGVSAQFGPNATGLGNRTEIYGTDLYLRYRPPGAATRSALSLQIESMFRTRQVPGDVQQDWGGYGELIWNISPRWETGARYEYVSGIEDDPLDPEWDDVRQRVSVQGTFYPSHFSRLRLQLAHDAPSWLEQPVWAAMLGLEVLVGAHGSHEY